MCRIPQLPKKTDIFMLDKDTQVQHHTHAHAHTYTRARTHKHKHTYPPKIPTPNLNPELNLRTQTRTQPVFSLSTHLPAFSSSPPPFCQVYLDQYQLCVRYAGAWNFKTVDDVGQLTCITGVPHLRLVVAGSTSGTLVMATVDSQGRISSMTTHTMHPSGMLACTHTDALGLLSAYITSYSLTHSLTHSHANQSLHP